MLDVSLSGQDKYADLGATIGLATMHLPIEVPFRAARQKCLSHIVSKLMHCSGQSGTKYFKRLHRYDPGYGDSIR